MLVDLKKVDLNTSPDINDVAGRVFETPAVDLQQITETELQDCKLDIHLFNKAIL